MDLALGISVDDDTVLRQLGVQSSKPESGDVFGMYSGEIYTDGA